jgi:hypothetical protein
MVFFLLRQLGYLTGSLRRRSTGAGRAQHEIVAKLYPRLGKNQPPFFKVLHRAPTSAGYSRALHPGPLLPWRGARRVLMPSFRRLAIDGPTHVWHMRSHET